MLKKLLVLYGCWKKERKWSDTLILTDINHWGSNISEGNILTEIRYWRFEEILRAKNIFEIIKNNFFHLNCL